MNRQALEKLLATVPDLDGRLGLLTDIEVLTTDEQITRDCRIEYTGPAPEIEEAELSLEDFI